jgi:hypothetical protein
VEITAPGNLSVLSAKWLREFCGMVRRGRSAQLLALIDRLPPEGGAVDRALAELVRVHAFDERMAVTEEAFKDGSHG